MSYIHENKVNKIAEINLLHDMTALAWPSSRGESLWVSNFQGLEVPWPLTLARNWTPIRESKHQKMTGIDGSQERVDKDTRQMEEPRQENTRRLSGNWVQAEGGKGGGGLRNDGRCRHAAWGAETSGRGCRWVGVDDIQVDDVTRQERRWGSGETESDMTTNSYWWGELGRKNKKRERSRNS